MPTEYVIAIIIGLAVFIGVPMAFKENNSWWFAIIRFWVFTLPLFFALMGIMIFFVGPVYALLGLAYSEYSLITVGYIYVFIVFISVKFINRRFSNILKTI